MLGLGLLGLALAAEPGPLELHADVFASDVQPANLALRGGLHHLQGLLQVGAGRAGQFVAGAGLAGHLGQRAWADLDGTCSIVQALRGAQETDLLLQLRLNLGYQAFERLGLFLGPAVATELSFAPNPLLRGSYLNPVVVLAPEQGGGGWQFWAGLQAGVRL